MKKIVYTMLFVLILILSVSSIQASDINDTNKTIISSNNTDCIQTDSQQAIDNLSDSDSLKHEDKIATEVSSQSNSIYYRGQFKVTLKDTASNMPLANKTINFTINNIKYASKTDNNGVAGIVLSLLPNKYTAKVCFTGDDEYLSSNNLTLTLEILSTINAKDLQKFKGDTKKFTAKFFTSDGNVLAKKTIKFKLKGKTYNVKTNSKGQATLSLKKLKKGKYKITCYNTDGLTKTFIIKIYKKKAKTKLTTYFYRFLQNESKELKVKFSTSIGGESVSGKTLKIKVNGRTYTRKTDNNGMVSLQLSSLNKGLYMIKYQYGGTKYFKASSSVNYLTVLDTIQTQLTVKSTTDFGYGAGTKLKLAVTAGGVPLIKKAVTFTIAGKKFIKTTDNNGIASLPINLAIGHYTVSYSTSADSKVNGSSDSSNITVFKRSNSKLAWKCPGKYKDSSQKFKVLVTDASGNKLSHQSLKLKIDGETYYAKTSSNGIATIKTSVALGKYKVSASFEGNNYYLESSSSKSVKVKLSLFKNGINEKHAKSLLSAYLKSSSHCKVGSKAIKSLVKSLTRGKSNKVDKAKAIFGYVRDKLSYSYYFNSKYGSGTTLKLKRGNCADHSHLLVAMFRTAGFKARYVHGKCTFSDERCGHVWTQVLIGKKWVCADATSYRNSLGKIANWNTKTVKIQGKYASLPF